MTKNIVIIALNLSLAMTDAAIWGFTHFVPMLIMAFLFVVIAGVYCVLAVKESQEGRR